MLVISIFFQIFCLSGIWAKPQPQVSKFVSQCGVRNKQGVGIPIENDIKRQAKVSGFFLQNIPRSTCIQISFHWQKSQSQKYNFMNLV